MQSTYIHNVAMTANTPFYTAYAGQNLPSDTFRIYVVLTATTSPVLSVRRTNIAGGGGTSNEYMNSGQGLVSGSAYIFDIMVAEGDLVTIQSNQNGNIETFILREVAQ